MTRFTTIALSSFLLLTACSPKLVAIKHKLPKKPDIREIVVKGDCICGEDLDNLIKNWTDLHDYIDQLENSGCFDKKSMEGLNGVSISVSLSRWADGLSSDEKQLITEEARKWLTKRKSPCQKAKALKWDVNSDTQRKEL